jgi:outer membrane protein assembly factor BamB
MTKKGDVSEELTVDAKSDPVRTKPNPNSALVWKFGGAIKPRPDMGRDAYLGGTISTCAVRDGLLFLTEYQGYLHCLDARTGKHYWEHDLKAEIYGSPYCVDGKIYIGNSDSDVCIFSAAKQEKQIAQIEMGEMIQSTPASANGVLFILSKSKLYAIASPAGKKN